MTFWNIFWIVLGALGLIVIAACIFFVFAACRVSGEADQATEKRIAKREAEYEETKYEVQSDL